MGRKRFICIGDPHFKPSNKDETELMTKAIISAIKEHKPDYIVIMGDTLDDFKRMSQYAYKPAIDFIYDLSELAPTYVLIGNHDLPDHTEMMSEYHPFVAIRNQPNIIIVNKPLVLSFDDFNGSFLFTPYCEPDRVLELFNHALKGEENKHIRLCDIFTHIEIKKCTYNGKESKHGASWPHYASHLTSGHIHNYQTLGDNVLYVGTPIQHDFADLERKSISLLEYSDREVDIYDIYDKIPKNTEYPLRHFKLPKHTRIFLGLKERKELRMTVDEIIEWEFDDKYKYKIVVVDKKAAIEVFYTTDQYKKLQKVGVRFGENAYSEVKQRLKNGKVKIASSVSYKKELWKRIKNDEEQVLWLEKILEGD